jgi:hypothetical protein
MRLRKLFVTILALATLPAMALAQTTQHQVPQTIGFPLGVNSNSEATLALNTSLTWLGFEFRQAEAGALSKLKFRVAAVAGTLGASDLRCEILRDINNKATGTVTVQNTGDTVTLAAHPFANGDIVRFTTTANGITGSDATPPVDIDYWVCNKAADTFQLDATSSACAAIVPITGDGTNYVRGIYDARTSVTATPTGALWVEFTGFTFNPTAGSPYWRLLRNMAAVPETNYPTYRWLTYSPVNFFNNINIKQSTTDGGATWGSAVLNIAGQRIEAPAGVYAGWPISADTTDGANIVYQTREVAAYLTTPANARLRVRGLAMIVRESGSPTGAARFRLYSGTTPSLIDTTTSILPANLSTDPRWVVAYFSSTHIIEPGTVLSVALGEETNSDTSANYYYVLSSTIENDANSKALAPFGGIQTNYYNGSSWALTDTLLPHFLLILDTDGEFAVTSSGGGTGRVVSQ